MWELIIIGLAIFAIYTATKGKKDKSNSARITSDISGLRYHRSEINKILKNGRYKGSASLYPDDEYKDSVSIYVDNHLVGYIPKQSRKAVRSVLDQITKVTAEIEKTREDGETIYSGSVTMYLPKETAQTLLDGGTNK